MESVQRAASPIFADCFGLYSVYLVIDPRQDFGIPFGPALFFALLVTVMFLWMKELFGRATGLFSALAVILTPNLFGYAHIAVTDLPLATMWFLTTYSFWKGLGSWKWSVALGIVWGLALATKFPALLIPAPLILWAHLFHRDKYVNNLFALLFLAPIVMVATQPYLWHQTGLRVLEFLYEGISRGYRLETNFVGFFFPPNFTFRISCLGTIRFSCRRDDTGADIDSGLLGTISLGEKPRASIRHCAVAAQRNLYFDP